MKRISTIRFQVRSLIRSLALAGALVAAWALAGPSARADITVLKHHNDIDARLVFTVSDFSHPPSTSVTDHSTASNAFTSYSGNVMATGQFSTSSANLSSTLLQNSVSIVGGVQAYTPFRPISPLGRNVYVRAYATANTVLQFTVSSTGYYNVNATSANASGSIQLLVGGAVVFHTYGTLSGRYLFTAGTVYEIDASAAVVTTSTGTGQASPGNYGVTVAPSN